MKAIVKVLGALALAISLAAASSGPAQAQSITLSFDRPHFPFIMWPHVRLSPRGHVAVRLGSDMPRWMMAGHRARCDARYQSYDPWSDTYLGYDGDRHFCRL